MPYWILKPPRCAGEVNASIQFMEVIGGLGPYQYSIDGETFSYNAFYNKLQPGNYTPTIIDANGCQWSTSVLIEEPGILEVDLGADEIIQLGDSIELSANISLPDDEIMSVRWNPGTDPDCTDCYTQMVKTKYYDGVSGNG